MQVSKDRGFTLIELLMVIAIIGILSSFVIANMGESRAQARDAERMNDLKQIQVALELYYNRNKSYPSTLAEIGDYIDRVPSDPIGDRSGSANDYQYQSDGRHYSIAALSDDEDTWCKFENSGSAFFPTYQDCPFY